MRQHIHYALSCLATTAAALTPCVAAAQVRPIDVPPGSLAAAIVQLGRQADVTIITTDPDAVRVRVRGVRGNMDVETALRRLLRGSGFEATRVGVATFTVRRARPSRAARDRTASVQSTQSAMETGPEIVVTGAKRVQPLDRFAGTAHVLSIDAPGLRNAEASGSASIVKQLPVLASTGLGPGRDKLFMRGIADSSFVGSTQAAIGQYLGDVRLNYNGPDPNLPLYDLSGVEAIEGPQATLYGAGSLGGILRLLPRPPVPGEWEVGVTMSGSAGANRSLGAEVAGVANIPLPADAAVRIVGYANTAPGLVDDIGRGKRAVGRIDTVGGRGLLTVSLGGGWSVDATGIYQSIAHRDARYAEGRDDPPTRVSAIAQPASNMFALASISVRKRWENGTELVSTNAVVKNDLRALYDLSQLSPDLANESISRGTVYSNETRISRSTGRAGGWLVGIHRVASSDYLVSTFTRGGVPARRLAISNGVEDIGLFGQLTQSLSSRWTVTLGGRLTYARVQFISDARVPRALPSIAFAWKPKDGMTAYAGFQRGYRVGGITHAFEDLGGGEPTFQNVTFRPDALQTAEAGLRFGQTPGAKIRGMIAVSGTRWRDVQADLFDASGPSTSNIGNGQILGIEGNVVWRVRPTLTVSTAAFIAHTRLLPYPTTTMPSASRRLPNIPGATFRLDMDWRPSFTPIADLSIRASARYVGESQLDVHGPSAIRQGGYLEASLSGEISRNQRSYFVEMDNILGTRGSRFASGNPFTASHGDQRIPLQPRTIRLGARLSF